MTTILHLKVEIPIAHMDLYKQEEFEQTYEDTIDAIIRELTSLLPYLIVTPLGLKCLPPKEVEEGFMEAIVRAEHFKSEMNKLGNATIDNIKLALELINAFKKGVH